jgi:hypothetical protein
LLHTVGGALERTGYLPNPGLHLPERIRRTLHPFDRWPRQFRSCIDQDAQRAEHHRCGPDCGWNPAFAQGPHRMVEQQREQAGDYDWQQQSCAKAKRAGE